jgi:glycerol-3-phosphate dehydrogenase
LPGLSSKVQTGFAYYDALMNDDLLVIDILRHAQSMGASVANYVEATDPIIQQNQIEGYSVLDHETGNRINVRAKLTVLCTGPWADIERARLGLQPLLKPSQGVHFVIPHSRLPIDGALMMIHPTDGRIAFAIARPDWGEGMTLVGTTDGPTNPDPHKARVTNAEVQYLLDLLGFYFPSRSLGLRDILSAYVGIRPLVAPATNDKSLAKVSREHHIERLQAGLWQVAGGKYTTHRTMAWDILDALMASSEGSFLNKYSWHKKTNSMAYNPYIHREERQRLEEEILNWREEAPSLLKHLLGSELREMKVMRERGPTLDLPGFPWLGARLRFAIRKHMVRHLDDFYLRRTSLWLARQDHGWPVAEFLASIWAEELDKTPADVEKELARLAQKLSELEAWRREPWLDRVNAKVA